MRNIRLLFTALFTIVFTCAYGQQTDSCKCDTTTAILRLCDDSLKCCITEMSETLKKELPKKNIIGGDTLYNTLVSTHTYRRYFSQDMAKILTLDNAINSINRYAALSIDEDKSIFTFSPFAARLHGRESPNEIQKMTRGYLNTFVKGKIDNDGIAEIVKGGKWNKEFTGGFSLVLLIGNGGGDGFKDRIEDRCHGIKKRNFRNIQRALPAELCRKYQKIITDVLNGDIQTYTDNSELFEDCESLQVAMRKNIAISKRSLLNRFGHTNGDIGYL
jgi:hypothetical protein